MQGKADRIAERCIRMLSGLLGKLFTDMEKQFLQRIGIRSGALSRGTHRRLYADKMLSGMAARSATANRRMYGVTGLMAHAVVDAADYSWLQSCTRRFRAQAVRIAEQLALVLVGQAGRGIQIDPYAAERGSSQPCSA